MEAHTGTSHVDGANARSRTWRSRRRIGIFLVLMLAVGFVTLTVINTIKVQGSWELVSVDGVPVESSAELTFDGRSVGGYDGCNSFGAVYYLVGPWLDISYRIQTLVGCSKTLSPGDGRPSEELDEQRVIKGWSKISVSSDYLELKGHGVTLTFAAVD